MKTEHPIYKAYKDGELIHHQDYAIDSDTSMSCSNSCINPKYCDDLRMLVPSALTSDGGPIYEGDTLYRIHADGTTLKFEVYFSESDLLWRVDDMPLAAFLCGVADPHTPRITHKKPKPERRQGERREIHRRDYDGRGINPNNRYSCEGKSDRRLSETPRRTS